MKHCWHETDGIVTGVASVEFVQCCWCGEWVRIEGVEKPMEGYGPWSPKVEKFERPETECPKRPPPIDPGARSVRVRTRERGE